MDDYRSHAEAPDKAMDSENYCLKVPLKIAQLLNLDMGRAFVGFVQESQNSRFFVDVLSWKMVDNYYSVLNFV